MKSITRQDPNDAQSSPLRPVSLRPVSLQPSPLRPVSLQPSPSQAFSSRILRCALIILGVSSLFFIHLDEARAEGAPLTSSTRHAAPIPPPNVEPDVKKVWYERVKINGFGGLWFRAADDYERDKEAPTGNQDNFRIRFARLSAAGSFAKDFKVKIILGLELDVPLLDLKMTWSGLSALHITAGQFKVPLSQYGLTSASKLNMMDRPHFSGAMIKSTFRDIGVMAHSSSKGLMGGLFGYSVGVFNGGGRHIVGSKRGLNEGGEFLFASRGTFNPGVLFMPKGGLLAFGVSYGQVTDPAFDGADPASSSKAKSTLGSTLVPYTLERETKLVEGDLRVEVSDFFVMVEILHLRSDATDGSVQSRSMGGSLELGYEYVPSGTQFVGRVEQLRPDQGDSERNTQVSSVGVNQSLGEKAIASLFGTYVEYPSKSDPTARSQSMRIESRLIVQF